MVDFGSGSPAVFARIVYIDSANAYLLGTRDFSYAFAIDPAGGHLKHLYWGAAISPDDVITLAADPADWAMNTPDTIDMRKPGALWRGFESVPRAFTEEIIAQGGFRFDEPTIAVETADGRAGLILRFVKHVIHDHADHRQLTVALRDEFAGIGVELHYVVHDASSVLTRWIEITNDGGRPVHVTRAASASWALPASRPYSVRNFFGHVQGEFQIEDVPLVHGLRRLGSRTGTSGHRGTPWIAVHEGATEQAGEVWSFSLAYSGSWQISTQLSDDGGAHVVMGVSDEEMRCILAPGARLSTPRSLGAYSDIGFDKTTDIWHTHVREIITPRAHRPLPVMYNSWFALQFALDRVSLIEQAGRAAKIGAELFVIDDGWFIGRKDDLHGLGRWRPDPDIFPEGMDGFRRTLGDLGMQLGLWVEPEMCTPDSDVFREHPEWIHGSPGRFWQTHRHQFVLNLGLAEVRDWVVEQISRVVDESGCAYIVWDMNRPLPLGEAVRTTETTHADGLTQVLNVLRSKHPTVVWQACSGGGGRADLGILSSMEFTWVSDNTDAHDRANMIAGASHVLPMATLAHWVTDPQELNPVSDRLQQTASLATRFHASMNGVLGISADLRQWSDDQMAEAASLVTQYKGFRHLIADGRFHRLSLSCPGVAFAYVAPDRSEAVVIVIANPFGYGESNPRLRLRGLDPEERYVLGDLPAQSGRLLMQRGFVLDGTQTASWLLTLARSR